MNNIKLPELLVPANNLNTLKYAINYGADAVYVGERILTCAVSGAILVLTS